MTFSLVFSIPVITKNGIAIMHVPVYTGEYKVEKGAGYDASNLKGSSVIVTGGASGIVSFCLLRFLVILFANQHPLDFLGNKK